jgi:hypothetical protein
VDSITTHNANKKLAQAMRALEQPADCQVFLFHSSKKNIALFKNKNKKEKPCKCVGG